MRPAFPIAAVILLAACSSGSPSPSATAPSAAAAASPPAECESAPLVVASGRPLDLTGEWQGEGMVHHVRQTGNCVWWIAYSTWPGTELGELETVVFSGHVRPDLTVEGSFSPVVKLENPIPYGYPRRAGQARFEIAFDEAGEPSRPELLGSGSGALEEVPDYFPELVRLGDLPEPEGPPQQD